MRFSESLLSSNPSPAVHSSPELHGTHDVIVMGGGLAGLTLSMQLKKRFGDIDVLVLERRAHPVPQACHKVGESTVEIGAHYFAEVLGLKEHLQQYQLPKFGFRFFFSDGRRDIGRVTELGTSRPLAATSYQIDRGIFENFLVEEAQARGVRFEGSAQIRNFELGDGSQDHSVTWQRPGAEQQTHRARWLVDASGRAGLVKRRLGLARDNAHAAHAVWFRIQHRLKIDDWCNDPEWRARCDTPTRWLSTSHLVGEGYWVWLIPLASGAHSVGIVADPAFHPLESMDSFDKAMDWLAQRQPRLHDELQPRRHLLLDFAYFRHFSHDCSSLLSAQRWALTGDAGRFLDPFYSPGSDFIAIGNTCITELIARDRAGQPLLASVQIYEQLLRSFHDSTMALYVDQYGLFGDPEVLPLKVLWDYSYYWSVPAQIFFQQRLPDLKMLARARDGMLRCQQLNAAVQRFLREWSGLSERRNLPLMHDQAAMPWFAELNRSLGDTLDDAGVHERLQQAPRLLRCLASELLERACGEHPTLDGSTLRAAINAAGGALHADAPLLFAAPYEALPVTP